MAGQRLSRVQQRILTWLWAHAQPFKGTMAADHQDLVRAIGTDKSNLHHSLSRLEAASLITITRTPGGKAKAVALTQRGQQVVRKPEVVVPRPTKRYRKMTGERWHARLVEIRQHLADLQRNGLFERLAETWNPEVQAGYDRELRQLIDQLTALARGLAKVRDATRSDDHT